MAKEKPNSRIPSELEKWESGFVIRNGNENSQENFNTSSIDKVRESDEYVVQGTGGSEKGEIRENVGYVVRGTGGSKKGEDKIVSDKDIPLIMGRQRC